VLRSWAWGRVLTLLLSFFRPAPPALPASFSLPRPTAQLLASPTEDRHCAHEHWTTRPHPSYLFGAHLVLLLRLHLCVACIGLIGIPYPSSLLLCLERVVAAMPILHVPTSRIRPSDGASRHKTTYAYLGTCFPPPAMLYCLLTLLQSTRGQVSLPAVLHRRSDSVR
jgi:hypothetical protein